MRSLNTDTWDEMQSLVSPTSHANTRLPEHDMRDGITIQNMSSASSKLLPERMLYRTLAVQPLELTEKTISLETVVRAKLGATLGHPHARVGRRLKVCLQQLYASQDHSQRSACTFSFKLLWMSEGVSYAPDGDRKSPSIEAQEYTAPETHVAMPRSSPSRASRDTARLFKKRWKRHGRWIDRKLPMTQHEIDLQAEGR